MTAATSPAGLADQAAEAVRALNHATLPGAGGFAWPCDVDAVIAALHVLVARLPQAFDQASAWLREEYVAGRVGHDSEPEQVFESVDLARCSLRTACTYADWLAGALNIVREETAHLTGVPAADMGGEGAP